MFQTLIFILINKTTKFFANNKPVKSTDYKTRLPDATLMEA
jgi:hypothetical protein